MHLFSAKHRFYGGYAIVGGGLPLAVGLALADHLRGDKRASVCFFGDGAVDEGEFHESLNLASLWNLPVLLLCENNLYAMGTALPRHEAETNISKKAEAYHLTSQSVDGMDVLAVEAAVKKAREHVYAGKGPYLLEARTYRFRAHSMYDAELYRSKDEVEEWKKKGPIVQFQKKLREWGWLTDDLLAVMEAQIADEIEDAVRFAKESPWEPIEDLTKDVYTPIP
jgi:TPP-dependent pyruvate/acetoin dehydrogenase alpha subunit